MLPQLMRRDAMSPHVANLTVGLTILAIGLFKKAVLADGVAQYASPVFDAATAGQTLTFFEAWGGALAYTLQLYFDFSGYSDMAIGAARLFGIRLPVNFHSPYKATNIVEFWRRWHMTLSQFLRDYLYIPLGGNRSTRVARYRNLMITMLLGGLWHGAGWTFVACGALHGFFLIVNHAWNKLSAWLIPTPVLPVAASNALAWTVTFIAVVIAWVFFRATSFDAALNILAGMAGLNGVALPNALAARLGSGWEVLAGLGSTTYLGGGTQFVFTWLWIGILLPAALFMPNTQQIMASADLVLHPYRSDPKNELRMPFRLDRRLGWQPTLRWSVTIACVAVLGVFALTSISEFLYFQF